VPTLVTEQGIVHYEAYGRGIPVILLHGWLGSWALWRDTIEELGKEFRTYALDFFGFGDSLDRSADFSVANFVQMVDQFTDQLGIPPAPIVGHSMGGTVALSVARHYPHKVKKVVVIGSPIQGDSLRLLLKLSGNRQFANLIWKTPSLLTLFLRGYSYLMARDGQKMGKMITSDMSKVTMDSFFQSIGTLREMDLREEIRELQMPVLGIYGKRDIIVDPRQGKVLLEYAPNSQEKWFDDAGHFPMIDVPESFHQTLRQFLSS